MKTPHRKVSFAVVLASWGPPVWSLHCLPVPGWILSKPPPIYMFARLLIGVNGWLDN